METVETLEIETSAELRAWLEVHHARNESLWLVTFKKSVPGKYVSTGQVLDELVAFGWTDGRRKRLDDARTMQLISPRRQQAWAQSYMDRAARLEAEGRLHAAGRAAIARAKASGQWEATADVDALIVPEDLHEALEARLGATAWFSAAAPSYRRNVLRWLKSAKTPGTRDKRIAAITASAAQGEKLPQM